MFDVKFDRSRKARIVAGVHRTDAPEKLCYSGVVPLDAVRLALWFLTPCKPVQLTVEMSSYIDTHMRSITLGQAQNLGNWNSGSS